jgi:hypothetical protein
MCLRKGRGEGQGGEAETPAGFIAVNVGGSGAEGGGFDTVLQRLCGLSLDSNAEGVWPLRRVDVLLEDDTEPSQNDDDADPDADLGTANAVLVGWGGGAMPPPMSVDDWASATAVGNRLAAQAAGRPLPFRMGTCISESFQTPLAPDLKAVEELCTAAGAQESLLKLSVAQLATLKGMLRPGVKEDVAASAFIAEAEAAEVGTVRLSATQLAKLKELLEPGRDDAAAEFLDSAELAEEASSARMARLSKVRMDAAEKAATAAASFVAAPKEVVAAAAAQSVVVHRVSFQEAENSDATSTSATGGAPGVAGGSTGATQNLATMAVDGAQKTTVLRIPKFLSKEEVAEVHREAEAFVAMKAAEKEKANALNSAPSEFGLNSGVAAAAAAVPMAAAAEAAAGGPMAPIRSSPQWETGRKWNVTFLHKEAMFKTKLPAIRAKILELGWHSDRDHWCEQRPSPCLPNTCLPLTSDISDTNGTLVQTCPCLQGSDRSRRDGRGRPKDPLR